MSRNNLSFEINRVVKGMITESSPLNFPQDASVDEVNFVLNRDGTRQRRLGMDFEDDYVVLSGSSEGLTSELGIVYTSFVWDDIGGLSGLEVVVVQSGVNLSFYKSGSSPLSSGLMYSYNIPQGDPTKQVQYASTGNALVVVYGNASLLIFEAEDNLITVRRDRIKIRDVFGVEDLDLETGKDMRSGNNISERLRDTISGPHIYNLRNQTWAIPMRPGEEEYLEDMIFSLARTPPTRDSSVFGFIASNADNANSYIHALPDDDHDRVGLRFSPQAAASENPGTTEAPRGYFIIDALNRGNSRVEEHQKYYDRWSGKGLGGQNPLKYFAGNLKEDYTEGGPSSVASFSGRFFLSGVNGKLVGGDKHSPRLGNYVFFSQLIKDTTQITSCYQSGDPTSRDSYELVDTDGGFVQIIGARDIKRLVGFGQFLLIFASNGVWSLSGGSDYGFSATNYRVDRISSSGCAGPYSVVDAGDVVLYWSGEGIMAIGHSDGGGLAVQNISESTIQKYYNNIGSGHKESVQSVYEESERRVRWLYYDEFDTYELVYDMVIGAFYPSKVSGELPPSLGLRTWGVNTFGRTGLGLTFGITSEPTLSSLLGDTEITTVEAGKDSTAVITDTGQMFTFGSGSSGKLGHGNGSNVTTPTRVGTDEDWSTVSMWDHTMAIKKDGTLWGCGLNIYAQLGLGVTGGNHLFFEQIGQDSDWKGVCCGDSVTWAWKTDGSVWSWGRNLNARTGQGTTSGNTVSPTRLENIPPVKMVSIQYRHALIVCRNGDLYSCGDGAFGKTGNGNTTTQLTPIKSIYLSRVSTAAAGEDSSLVVTTNGRALGFGSATSGMLGYQDIGGGSSFSTPREITGFPTDFVNCYTGNLCSILQRADGSILFSGFSESGLPGDNGSLKTGCFQTLDTLSCGLGNLSFRADHVAAFNTRPLKIPKWTNSIVMMGPPSNFQVAGLYGLSLSRLPVFESDKEWESVSVNRREDPASQPSLNMAGSRAGPNALGRYKTALSGSGNAIFAPITTPPYVAAWRVEDDKSIGNRYDPPSTPPTGHVYFKYHRSKIALLGENSELLIYKWSDSTGFGTLYEPPELGGAGVTALEWANDGKSVLVGLDAAPFLKTYRWDETFGFGEEMSPPQQMPITRVISIEFHPSGEYVIIGRTQQVLTGTGVLTYAWDNDTGYVGGVILSGLPDYSGAFYGFSADGRVMVFGAGSLSGDFGGLRFRKWSPSGGWTTIGSGGVINEFWEEGAHKQFPDGLWFGNDFILSGTRINSYGTLTQFLLRLRYENSTDSMKMVGKMSVLDAPVMSISVR